MSDHKPVTGQCYQDCKVCSQEKASDLKRMVANLQAENERLRTSEDQVRAFNEESARVGSSAFVDPRSAPRSGDAPNGNAQTNYERAVMRVTLMASGDPTWDLSPADLTCLKVVLDALNAMTDGMRLRSEAAKPSNLSQAQQLAKDAGVPLASAVAQLEVDAMLGRGTSDAQPECSVPLAPGQGSDAQCACCKAWQRRERAPKRGLTSDEWRDIANGGGTDEARAIMGLKPTSKGDDDGKGTTESEEAAPAADGPSEHGGPGIVRDADQDGSAPGGTRKATPEESVAAWGCHDPIDTTSGPNACAGCAKAGRARARGEQLDCMAHPNARHATTPTPSATWDPVGGRPINPDVMAAAAMSETPSSRPDRLEQAEALLSRAHGLLEGKTRVLEHEIAEFLWPGQFTGVAIPPKSGQST